MAARTWALATTVGTGAALAYFARPISTGNRVYVSVRRREELDRLLAFPNPLLANFCIYTDPLSKRVSETLQLIAKDESTAPIGVVDVELDEGDTAELAQRYMVTAVPTVVALKSGTAVSSFSPSSSDNEKDLEAKLRSWIAKID